MFKFLLFLIAVQATAQEFTRDCRERYQQELEARASASLAHYRIAECAFKLRDLSAAADEFRAALSGDQEPKWVVVWSRIHLGKIFDVTGQRDRALSEYRFAEATQDDTFHAQDEVVRCKESPCKR